MIYGQGNANPISALQFIQQSATIFYLTGSRCFGTATEQSDWDFFTEMTPTIDNYLLTAGFTLDSESYEGDPLITRVYKLDNVHVQIVNNCRRKRWVQEQLFGLFCATKPNKELAKRYWAIAMKMYNGGMEEGQRLAHSNL